LTLVIRLRVLNGIDVASQSNSDLKINILFDYDSNNAAIFVEDAWPQFRLTESVDFSVPSKLYKILFALIVFHQSEIFSNQSFIDTVWLEQRRKLCNPSMH
jgi:hypothetical protein